MAILNDLIVRGATRCLNTLYANSLQVDSQTISGNLTVNGYTYMGYSTSRSDTKLSVAGITNNQWYRSSGSVGWYNDSYGGGIYMTDSTYVKTYNNKAFYAYNGLYTGSTQQYYLNVNGKLNAADGVFSNNLNVGNSLVSRNISATNLLRAAKYDLQTITQVGSNGTLYVAPSIQFPTSNTTSVAAASTSITIIDTNITSDVMAGVVWRPSAKVKISGTINGVVTGTVDGTITSINTSSKTMVIGNLSGGNWSSVVAGTYTKDKIENLNIMMYETYQNSTYYPVGILLTSYGSVGEHTDGTAKTFIDIFGGSATKSVVRLGNMTGLDAINGVTPSGWGLYTSNGYFSGLIVSTSGKIGGWSLSTNSLTTGTWGSSGSAMLCTGSTGQKSIGGSPASTNGWVFTAGANFGVTSSGALYANSAHISGEITATSGAIGGASITGGTLLIKDANISGKISANHIDVSSITIGSLSGADNYALKDDVPTTVAELTDSGSYLTTSAASTTYATQTAANNAAKTATTYIANIDSNKGITIKPSDSSGNDYLQINSSAITTYRNNIDVMSLGDSSFRMGTASGKHTTVDSNGLHVWIGSESTPANEVGLFGSTARIGAPASSRFLLNADSLQAYNSSNVKYFEVSASGLSFGGNAVAKASDIPTTVSQLTDSGNYLTTTAASTTYATQTAANNAAKTATTYITYVNATDGIKVHNASDTNNYLQLNSSAISMYKGGTKIFNVDSNGYITVGKEAASKRNVYITDDAVQIRNNTSVLAEYGSDIVLGEVGTDKNNIYISPDTGIDIRNNTTSLANFSDTVRIGNDEETNIQITPTNVVMTAPNGSVALKMFFSPFYAESGAKEYGVRITDEHNISTISINPALDSNSEEFTDKLSYSADMKEFHWQISNASFSLTEQGFGVRVGTDYISLDTNGVITISDQSPFFYEDVVVTVSYAAGTIGTRGTQVNCGTTAKSGYKYIGASVLSHTNTSLFSVNLIRNDSTANLHLMAYRASGSAVSDADVTVRKFWVNDHILDHFK